MGSLLIVTVAISALFWLISASFALQFGQAEYFWRATWRQIALVIRAMSRGAWKHLFKPLFKKIKKETWRITTWTLKKAWSLFCQVISRIFYP